MIYSYCMAWLCVGKLSLSTNGNYQIWQSGDSFNLHNISIIMVSQTDKRMDTTQFNGYMFSVNNLVLNCMCNPIQSTTKVDVEDHVGNKQGFFWGWTGIRKVGVPQAKVTWYFGNCLMKAPEWHSDNYREVQRASKCTRLILYRNLYMEVF